MVREVDAKARVESELKELREKILKLDNFLNLYNPVNSKVSEIQYGLLRAQLHSMRAYANILEIRLEYWEGVAKL